MFQTDTLKQAMVMLICQTFEDEFKLKEDEDKELLRAIASEKFWEKL